MLLAHLFRGHALESVTLSPPPSKFAVLRNNLVLVMNRYAAASVMPPPS